VDHRAEIKLTAVKALGRAAAVGAAGMATALLVAGCSSAHPHSASTTPVTGSSPQSSPPSSGAAGTARPGTSAASSGSRSPTSAPSTPTAAAGGPNLPASYPTPSLDPSQAADQSTVLASLPGSTSSSCESVGSHTDLRSGSIAAGNFAHARAQYTETAATTEAPQVDLYVIPRQAAKLTSVTITVDPTGNGPTTTLTSKSVEQADAWSYFAVQLPVPAPGNYQLTMVSGPDRGCFLLTFSK
jgi:hypothetical protein